MFKYPVRLAINPFISTIGWTLPAIVSGETITAIGVGVAHHRPAVVPCTAGAGHVSGREHGDVPDFLTVIGTLISDILLVLVDPRIRYQRGAGR